MQRVGVRAQAVSPIWRRSRRRAGGPLPPPGVLRRERRALLELREERLRDLGGLLLEMFRRNRFREDLVRQRCEELVELDEHIASLEALLGIAWTATEPLRCACGAAAAPDARFCPACGRSLGDEGRACRACGYGLADDASFCSRCGAGAGQARAEAAPRATGDEPKRAEQDKAAAELSEGPQ